MNSQTIRKKQLHQFKETARKDPYRSQSKPRGTLHCPKCGSVSFQGRWRPLSHAQVLRPPLAGELKCPACKQLEDRYAMGVIELHGDSWKAKKDLVINTIRHTETIARLRNDQERVLWIKELKDITKIYVSLPELARHIGLELKNSFRGITQYLRTKEEPYLRVCWYSDLPQGKSKRQLQEAQANHKSRAFRRRSLKA